jgi:hypothetical protein
MTQVSGLCDETPSYFSKATWPQDLANAQQLSVEALMARWASGLDYVLDLGDEAQLLRSAIA